MPYARARISAISHLPGHPRNRQPSGNPGSGWSTMEGEDGEQQKGVVVRSERTIKGEIRETKNHPEAEEIENEEEEEKKKQRWMRTRKETQRGKTRRSARALASSVLGECASEETRRKYDVKRESKRDGERKRDAKVCLEGARRKRRVSVEIYRSASYGNLAVAAPSYATCSSLTL